MTCVLSMRRRAQNYRVVFFSPRPGRTLERIVEKIVIHEKYSSYSHYYDIAAVRFDRDLLRPFMPICLPTPSYASRQLAEKVAHVIGWGSTKFGNPLVVFFTMLLVRKRSFLLYYTNAEN